MKKICFVLTAEFAVKAFLREHIRTLSKNFDVYVVVNTNNPDLLQELGLKATLIPLAIKREISPIFDFMCLVNLSWIFVRHRFDAVHSITPKAGLLAMLSGWLTFRSVRVHTFQGEVWVTKKGFMRWLLISLDKLVAMISTHLTVVSKSEKKFLSDNKVINSNKAIVFSEGSISGVDTTRFYPDFHKRIEIREKLNIPLEDTALLFIGRINRDKGILDLVSAYAGISSKNVHLIIVGPDEHNLSEDIINRLSHKKHLLHLIPETDNPADFMNVADILCLPSYREGFGVVIIEAAACAVPCIASNIYGITDAVINEETGLLHAPGDINDIRNKINILLGDPAYRKNLGQKALNRVLQSFNSIQLTQAWLNFYLKILDSNDKKII